MSANNWTKCPRCEKHEQNRQVEASKAAESAYGKVSASEYMRLLDIAKPRLLTETRREDWELFIKDGAMHIYYATSCENCDFEHSVKEDHPVQI